MKTLTKTLLLVGLVFAFTACEELLTEEQPTATHEAVITGLKQSLGIDIISNGRVDSMPSDVQQLTVFILDANKEVVYENRYYGYNYYDFYQSIPDSIFIPSLPEGDYQLMAVTLDYYSYYDRSYEYNLMIEPYYSGISPIYVGNEAFTLTEDEQVVNVYMQNISAKIDISLVEGQQLGDGSIGIGFETENGKAYDFETGQLVEFDEYYPIHHYAYLGDYYYYYENGEERPTSTSLYLLPTTITKVNIEYWDYYGNYISQSLDIDPAMVLEVDDQITISVDLEKVLEGAGAGFFEWEDISWNEKGTLSIP